jgi:hypothetical protein
MTEPDLKQLWTSQQTEEAPMPIEDIRRRTAELNKRVRRRNLIEYVAAVFVVIGFTPYLLHGGWMIQGGAALTMAATGFVVWQLHRRTAMGHAPDAGRELVDYHRAELVRQRDAIRSAGLWYIAPLVPGLVMMALGRWFQAHAPGRPVEIDHLVIGLCLVIVALGLLAAWLWLQMGALRLQKRIDDLDALLRN